MHKSKCCTCTLVPVDMLQMRNGDCNTLPVASIRKELW